MSSESGAELFALVRDLALLSPARLEQLGRGDLPDAATLTRSMVEQGWLTEYQAGCLLSDCARDLNLGPYVLLEPLGEGGVGRVFLARHRQLDRLEAVKVLRPEHLDNPDVVARFQREAKAVARLNHPHVVRLHGVGEADGQHFLAMEYVAGIDLCRLVERDGPLPPAWVVVILRQAALGLQHAHENGLIHRDVKPSNLLLVGDVGSETAPERLTVKVLDLGLARLREMEAPAVPVTELTPSGLMMGTPDYVSPEQSLNSRKADIRSDLYSLGCTAYHLLAGHPPFLGGGLMEKLLRHQTEPPPPLKRACPEVPADLAAVIAKLMEKDQALRYQTPAELARAVGPLLGTAEGKPGKERSVAAPPAETVITPRPEAATVRPTGRGTGRGLVLLVGGLAFAALALGLVAGLVWLLRGRG